jgi:hypothetical protein
MAGLSLCHVSVLLEILGSALIFILASAQFSAEHCDRCLRQFVLRVCCPVYS